MKQRTTAITIASTVIISLVGSLIIGVATRSNGDDDKYDDRVRLYKQQGRYQGEYIHVTGTMRVIVLEYEGRRFMLNSQGGILQITEE